MLRDLLNTLAKHFFMQRKPVLYLLAGLLSFTFSLSAQTLKFSEDPTQFLTEIKKVLEGSKNAQFIQTSKELEANWETTLNTTQRQQFISLFRTMAAKGHRSTPILNLVTKNVNYLAKQGGDVNGFMIAMDHAAEHYDPKSFQKVVETAQLITEKKTLYQSNFNKLYLASGQYRFRFEKPTPKSKEAIVDNSWDTPSDSSGNVLTSTIQLPEVAGALLDLQNATFAIVSSGDSVFFGPSTGSIALSDGIFVGKEGKFNWQSAGDSTTYVTLKDFAFNITKPALRAENVTLYNKNLEAPLVGYFEYKSIKKPANKISSGYPRFMSNAEDAKLKNYPNIIYKGGFTLIGHEVFTSSRRGNPARITVLFQNKPAFSTTSKQFSLRDSVIVAQQATFTLPMGADSLFHPGIALKYNDSEGYLHLDRITKSEYTDLPYVDTYHKVYLWSESARWKLAKEQFQLYMVTGKTEAPAFVESHDYFKKNRFNAITQEFGFQPLLVAANIMQNKKKKSVHADEMAAVVKKTPQVVRRVLERLTLDDFFQYQPAIDEFSLSRKGIFYIMANSEKADFDNFRITSIFPSNNELANLSISLKDTLLTVRGVERFVVSDSLKIVGIPSDRIVIMGRNRDFTLNGKLQSSNFKFTGRNLKFNYDDFFINMTDMDSITYIPRENYVKGGGGEIGGSVKYEKGGTFYLSDSKNKSGTKKGATGSPRILIPDGVTVFFNQPERGQWIYPEEVNFKVPKLDVGGLDKKDIEFNGDFNSNGIIPPIKATLKSMPDNSLGFEYATPAEGIKLYEGKATAKFPEKLKMDNTGLHGKAQLSYLAATIPAENIVLMPDSMVAHGTQASIKESTINKAYFPKADIKDYTLLWTPKTDSMLVQTKGNAVSFYNGSTELEGNLIIRSTGLFGAGFLKRNDADIRSNSIKFKKEGFDAKDASIEIKGGDTGSLPILAGQSLDVDFNIINGSAQLTKNTSGFDSDSASIRLPQANYYTNIDQATWNTKTKTITMKAKAGTATFRSLHEDQEGLNFEGNGAVYAIDKKSLNVTGVPFVQVAGMKVVPNKGDVFVDEKGELQTFTKARIEIDTLDIRHRMSDATVKIISRNRLEGAATYQYITSQKDTFNIKLGNFELHELQENGKRGKNATTKSSYTTAVATLTDEDKLLLAPGIAFKGDIKFTSYLPSLDLDGHIRPQLKNRANLNSSWINYKEKPGANITLKVDKNLRNEDNIPLYAGLHFGLSNDMYPTFLSFKEDERDPNLFLAEGIMGYNSEKKAFQIVQPHPTDTLSQPRVVASFNDTKGLMDFNGKLSFGNLITAAGTGQAQVDSMRVTLNTLLAFNWPALTPINTELATKIVAANLEERNSDPAEDDLQRLFNKLEALIGVNETKVYADKLAAEYKPLPTASPLFDVPMVLSNVTLNWSPIHKAYYSSGAIGIANFGKNDVNAQVEGMMEIRNNEQGDGVSLYLEITPELWYYFELINKELGVVSSDMEFNDLVSAKSRNAKIKDMSLIPLGPEDKTMFVDRYYTTYLPNTPRKPKTVKKAPAQKAKPKTTKPKEEEAEGF